MYATAFFNSLRLLRRYFYCTRSADSLKADSLKADSLKADTREATEVILACGHVAKMDIVRLLPC